MKIEFNLVTRRETLLDNPPVWYGALSGLGLVVPVCLVWLIVSCAGEFRAVRKACAELEDKIDKLSRPAVSRKLMDSFRRKAAEAADIARRCSTRPSQLVRRIAALVPPGVRLRRLELSTSANAKKTITGEAVDRAALSALLSNLDGPGRETISSFELKREDRLIAGEGTALHAASRDEALAAGVAPIRFTVTFRLAGGGL